MITINDMKRVVLDHHKDPQEWIVLFELRMSTGYEMNSGRGEAMTERRIDAMAFSCFPSKKLKRIAYEIKLTRSDFLREIADPQKRFLTMLYSNQYFFVAPEGVIEHREIPYACGLITVDSQGYGTMRHNAQTRELHPVSNGFLAAAVRNAYKDGRDTKRVSLNTELLKDKEKC
jgi:hypothetical protein